MIELLAASVALDAAGLVLAALRRSVSTTQARRISGALSASTAAGIIVAIEPDEEASQRLLAWMAHGPCKLILLGRLSPTLVAHLGLRHTDWPGDSASWSRSPPAPTYASAQSMGAIRYTPVAGQFGADQWQRPLERFDFTDEWNNLGFGAVRADEPFWSLSMPVRAATERTLAEVAIDGLPVLAYCALVDQGESSILWFNRQVGPIDSFEWRLVERFLSSWRYGELPCQPVLQEIPWGHEAAVTMRLDCDEDVESARPLRGAYHAMGIPFSLAVHTTNLDDPCHHGILREMALAGESILSHTATHAPNWGGSYEAALREARESASRLQAVTGQSVRYAVSPFHQSPPYALAALVDAGYYGCIGGIIRNDPEFLIARGGALADLPAGFIGHSQQHMLHGDCLLAEGDPLAVFKQAFDRACETRTLFGYLDHPFSARYQYGWPDETTRIAAHRALVDYIRIKAPGTLFLSENDALDFLLAKSEWQVVQHDEYFELQPPSTAKAFSPLLPTIEYAGKQFEAVAGRLPA
ncbi:polysaccharide deacetylase [Dechloromonas denitrificans]|uniref:Polysaccharide deacetylase n=1 Tax=Dechloromonas denitrificans TaxID=281362 RepID=A0A133XGQ1_9RHOO|nr:polysaccharide deacetylase family protein [Dechloromonas denitrificans]KXB30120.1 polysaccharide deacetylase [Dechloromonas denitrificans]